MTGTVEDTTSRAVSDELEEPSSFLGEVGHGAEYMCGLPRDLQKPTVGVAGLQ